VYSSWPCLLLHLYHMDPLCIVVAMDYSYILHIPWIHSVLSLVAMLTSLLSMGMPDLGNKTLA
jgi:hypothetical protein